MGRDRNPTKARLLPTNSIELHLHGKQPGWFSEHKLLSFPKIFQNTLTICSFSYNHFTIYELYYCSSLFSPGLDRNLIYPLLDPYIRFSNTPPQLFFWLASLLYRYIPWTSHEYFFDHTIHHSCHIHFSNPLAAIYSFQTALQYINI